MNNKRYADVDLPAEDSTDLDAAITTAETKTADYPTETIVSIKHLIKIGPKSESFSREALELARLYQDLLPRGLDLAKFQKALDNRDATKARYLRLVKLAERVKIAMTLMGVDAYSDGLIVYNALQRGTDESLRQAVDYLGRHFERTSDEERTAPETDPAP